LRFADLSESAADSSPRNIRSVKAPRRALSAFLSTITSTNGKIARNVRVEGEYVVNADCTSTVSYSDGTHYDQFLAPDGKTFVFVQTNESSPKWIAAA
jgi:hypothetical protein